LINRFYDDYTCKAVYRFETDAINVDSQHTNHLVNSGVTNNLTDYQEGYASAQFNGSARFSLADTSLSAGFPLKWIENPVDREENPSIISAAFWIKFTDVIGMQAIVAKHDPTNDARCWMIYVDSGVLKVAWGINGGIDQKTISSQTTLVANRWYHIGVSCSSVELLCQFYIWDSVVGNIICNKLYQALNDPMTTCTADFTIGSDHAGDYKLSATLDELVIFNTYKKPNEYDQIRKQEYVGPLKNSLIDDPSCKAWFDFEPDQMLFDWQNGHVLTDVNTISPSQTFFKCNKQAVYFNKINKEYAYISDSSLQSGFPLKLNDSDCAFTFAFWVRLDDDIGGTIVSKSANTNGQKSLVLYFSGTTFQVRWGYGTDFQTFSTIHFTTHRWYHVAVAGHGTQKILTIRIWDDVQQSVVYFNLLHPTNSLIAGAGPFSIGYHSGVTEYFAGWLDELLIFNQPKSLEETDLMRKGLYHRPLLYACVESVCAQPTYWLPDGLKVVSVGVQPTFIPVAMVKTCACGMMVQYYATNRFTANNMHLDPDCVAAYSFESGSMFLSDSIGGNDLTDHGTIDPVQ